MTGFEQALAISRRRALALGVIGLAAGVSMRAHRAGAEGGWCWDDPILEIDGKLVRINIGIQGSGTLVRAHVQNAHTIVYLPPNVPARIAGFTINYFPETAEIRRASHLKWVRPSPGGESVSKVDFEAYTSFRTTRVLPAIAQVVYPVKEITKNGDVTNKTIKIGGTLQ